MGWIICTTRLFNEPEWWGCCNCGCTSLHGCTKCLAFAVFSFVLFSCVPNTLSCYIPMLFLSSILLECTYHFLLFFSIPLFYISPFQTGPEAWRRELRCIVSNVIPMPCPPEKDQDLGTLVNYSKFMQERKQTFRSQLYCIHCTPFGESQCCHRMATRSTRAWSHHNYISPLAHTTWKMICKSQPYFTVGAVQSRTPLTVGWSGPSNPTTLTNVSIRVVGDINRPYKWSDF
jgi:hypothetical protein